MWVQNEKRKSTDPGSFSHKKRRCEEKNPDFCEMNEIVGDSSHARKKGMREKFMSIMGKEDFHILFVNCGLRGFCFLKELVWLEMDMFSLDLI